MAYNLNAKVHVLKNGSERVTSNFGQRSLKFNNKTYNSYHYGIDLISRKYGTDYIIAFADGTVSVVNNNVNGYSETYASGNYIVIKHNNGYDTRYLHLKKNSMKVKVGDKVKKGQVIAYMNSSGFSTGNHLHFEIRKNGVALNPKNYLLGKNSIKSSKTSSVTKKATTSKQKSTATKTYTVKKGDSLWKIAEKYYENGTKYKQIAKLNNIKSPYIIYPGQKLNIY